MKKQMNHYWETILSNLRINRKNIPSYQKTLTVLLFIGIYVGELSVKSNKTFSNLQLANVEAIAQGESIIIRNPTTPTGYSSIHYPVTNIFGEQTGKYTASCFLSNSTKSCHEHDASYCSSN